MGKREQKCKVSRRLQKASNAFHQISNAYFKIISNGLNCEQRRILHAALNTAQKSPVNGSFGCEGFLRQPSLQSRFNTLSELFCNVMPHSPQFLSGHNRCGCPQKSRRT